MYANLSDKLAEVLGYLTKTATQAPGSSWGNTAMAVADPALSAYEAYNTGVGTRDAYSAYRTGQGGRQAINTFAQRFGAPAAGQAAGNVSRMGQAGRVLGAVGIPLAAAGTAASVYNQTQNAKEYKGTGRSYLGSSEGFWDTWDTASSAAPLVGAGVGAGFAGVGAIPGAAIGGAVGLGMQGVKYVGQGLTGFDSQKNSLARAGVKGQGYTNSADYLSDGIAQANLGTDKETTSTSWTGKKRDFKQENLTGYLNQERSLTNKGQVA
jgi:hypothetical protein